MVNSITNTAFLLTDVLQAAVDNGDFTIQGADADVMSLEISLRGPVCLEGYQVAGNYCVECGPGTYFSTVTKTCQSCARGQYQNLWGQTSCKMCPNSSPITWGQGSTSVSNCYIACGSGHYYDYRDGMKACLACPKGTYQPVNGTFYCMECDIGLTTAKTRTKNSRDCIDPDLITTESTTVDNNAVVGQSMAEDTGLSDEIVIAIAILCFFILIVLVIFILICICKNKISFLQSNDITEEEISQKSRFGEAKIDFITRRLNKVRHQRGAQPIYEKRHQRHSFRHHDNMSYYEDDPMSPRHYQNMPPSSHRYPRENESYAHSIQLRRYEESLTDGYSPRRSRTRKLSPLDGARTADLVTKSKSKKKRRSEDGTKKRVKKSSRNSEAPIKTEVPLNQLPDSSKLKEAGWSNNTARNAPAAEPKPEVHPNAFSDSEASDVDIIKKSKKTSKA
ncbi:uncharacterized protein LOC117340808 [Pecten maximus]|uniref:uncharacterized protein LOC117340808 n=1 Tax=Pecten maximus TaxID=6579 RepID=UPI00145859BA|nr:uncharacterized protein LOC117340808 [Pecten maximus]